MKKYFLVGFLFLQVGFLYAQKASEKLPFKKWEYGLQSNIFLTNRIYVERYFKENLSIKTSFAHEFLFLVSFLTIESEFRYYLKKRNKKQTFFNAGISLRSSVLVLDHSIDEEDSLDRDPEAKRLGRDYYFYIPFSSPRNLLPGFHLGVGKKMQFAKKVHFEYGFDVYLLYFGGKFYPVLPAYAFTFRFGFNWNKN